MIRKALDQYTPGYVYMCQVSEKISCGACCGLYSIENISRKNIDNILNKRSILFESVARNIDGLIEYESEISKLESQVNPYPDFHHCPFVGFMGDKVKTVGCLLHPLAKGNNGIDYRGISYYGGMACKNYFCLTCKKLTPRYKKIVRCVIDDWYLYGLIVTEWEMLNCLFFEIEHMINRELTAEEIGKSEFLKSGILAFLSLKIESKLSQNIQANYFFEDQKYKLPEINYPLYNLEVSKYDVILRCFRFKINSASELMKAETLVKTNIQLISELIQNI